MLTVTFRFFPPKNLERHVPHGVNEVLERNYDGPLYVAIAKTLYDPKQLERINFIGFKPSYYPSHFPLYPLAIKTITAVTHDFFRSMILVNWLSGAAAAIVFYFILEEKKVKRALFLSTLFLFLPPRWLAVRSVGASEGIFVLLLLLLALFWIKKKYLFAATAGALLVLTRPPGILFFPAIVLWGWSQKMSPKQILPFFLMPIALICLFAFYYLKFGDLLIFMHNTSGTSTLVGLLPFQAILGYSGPIAEGFIYLYAIYAIGLYLLWKQEKSFAALCSLYFVSTFFLRIDDVPRELIPISGFTLIYAYKRFLTGKIFSIFVAVIIIATFIYTIDLLPRRMFPYDDYARLRISNGQSPK